MSASSRSSARPKNGTSSASLPSSAAQSSARSTSAQRGGRDGGLGVGDAAEIAVLAEHEARDGEPRLGLRAAQRLEPVALGAPQDHLDAGEAEPLRAPEELAVVRARQHVGHHAGEARHSAHRRAVAGRPSGRRPASARATAGCGGPSCTARGPRRSRRAARPSSPRAPPGTRRPRARTASTSPSRSSSRKSEPSRTLPRIVPSVPWIQNGAPPRDGARVADRADQHVRAARAADLDVRAPGIARVVRLAGHAVVGRRAPRRAGRRRASSG